MCQTPGSITILDYYHALEHLHQLKEALFGDKAEGKLWAEKQAAQLLESETGTVIDNIRAAATDKTKDAAAKLISYYESNKNRTDYKHYKTIGQA